jgi:hypothetical protein
MQRKIIPQRILGGAADLRSAAVAAAIPSTVLNCGVTIYSLPKKPRFVSGHRSSDTVSSSK